ncbi:hypothetical protein D3C79_943920 [compost metagenome]
MTLPLLPASSDAACAAFCAVVTFWLVAVRLAASWVVCELAEDSPCSVFSTRAVKAFVAEAPVSICACSVTSSITK